MYCPRCRQEYREGISICRECRVALVPALADPGHDEPEWRDLVTVLETNDRDLLVVIQSLLESNGVRSWVQGAPLRDVIGGRPPLGMDLAWGPMELQVAAGDEQAARELIDSQRGA